MREVQLFDADLAVLGVQVGGSEFHRQRLFEFPRKHSGAQRVEHRDSRRQPVRVRAVANQLEPLIEIARASHAAFENHGGESHGAGALHHAIIAAALLDDLRLHGGLQPRALRKRSAAQRHGRGVAALLDRVLLEVHLETENVPGEELILRKIVAHAASLWMAAPWPPSCRISTTVRVSMGAAAVNCTVAITRPLSRSFWLMVVASQRTW